MKRCSRIFAFCITAFFLAGTLAIPARAETKTPLNKATRGGVNLTTGWLEIPNQIVEYRQRQAPLWLLHGLVYGLGMTVVRTMMGAYDVVSFPFGPYDRPVLDPETLIQPRTQPRHLEKASPG